MSDATIVALDRQTSAGREFLEKWLRPADVAKSQGRRYVGGLVPPDDPARTFVFAVDSVEALCSLVCHAVDLAAPYAMRSVDGLGVFIKFRLDGLPDDARARVNAALDARQAAALAAMPSRGDA